MRRLDGAIALAALIVSLSIHAVLFLHTGSYAGNSETVTAKQSVTRVSFRSVAAPQTLPQSEPQVLEKPPESVVTEAPEPPPRPKPVAPPEPAKRAKKVVEKELPKYDPREEQGETAREESAAEAEKSAADVVAGTVEDPALIEQAKQEYLRRLMAHIESHKHYPRAARRRGIEGDTSVTFVLHEAGRISGLGVEGKQRILNDAASEAVLAAQPMPVPPDTQPLPWTITFTMRFNLR